MLSYLLSTFEWPLHLNFNDIFEALLIMHMQALVVFLSRS